MEAAFRMAYAKGCESRGIKANSRLMELLTNTTASLSRVDLSNNYLGPNGLRALSEALVANSKVTTLNLANVLLDDAQLEALMGDLTHPRCRVNTLILDANELTHRGGRMLFDLARARPQFVHISVERCRIKESIVARIREQCALNAARAASRSGSGDIDCTAGVL